ncbi:MAG: AAA family ATPase, partial [Firmicutes bacterium]|nr:AAA family ATPase [Bacillota bacterium]
MGLEIAIGAAAALAVFAAALGYDPTPVVVGLAAFAGLRLFLSGKGAPGLGQRFQAVKVASGGDGNRVQFSDIGGQESAKRELLEALEFMRDVEKARKLGIRPLRGILLTGPPGTGKTLMAKAAANYTGSVFVAASGSEFVEVYAGVGAQRVRQLFQRARQLAKEQHRNSAVVFIDEIDILGGARGRNASHQEYDQTLNQLLVEMDGLSRQDSVQDSVRVLVVGATNRLDILDPALLRPGRFDRIVRVDLPDRDGRLHILRIHTRNKPLAPDVDLAQVAAETFGFSGAHLESVANEAAILAMRQGQDQIHAEHFREAVEKVMMGERLDRHPTAGEKERVALHESGHALVTEWLRPGAVASLTIAARGQALGYVRQVPEDDAYLYTREELDRQIAICLAGAVAEEVHFGCRSTGASGDYEQAIDLAKKIVHAGLSDLGVVSKDSLPADKLDQAIHAILAAQEKRVREFLLSHRAALSALAEEVLQRERLDGQEVRAFLKEDPRMAARCAEQTPASPAQVSAWDKVRRGSSESGAALEGLGCLGGQA